MQDIFKAPPEENEPKVNMVEESLDVQTVETLSEKPLEETNLIFSRLQSQWTQILQTWEPHALDVLYALLLLLAFNRLWRWLNAFFGKLLTGLSQWQQQYIPNIQAGKLVLVPPERIEVLLRTLIQVTHLLLNLTLVLVVMTVLFGIFPATQWLAKTLLNQVFNLAGFILGSFWQFVPNMLTIVFVCIIANYLLKGLRYVAIALATGRLTINGFHREWVFPTYKLVRFVVLVLAFVMVVPYLPGYNSPAFNAVGVFFGVLITFGSTSAVANIIAGIVLVYMRPFKVGDRVEVGDTTGDVMEMSLLVTRIRTIKNVEITVPNALILSSPMMNYSSAAQTKGLILHTGVTIGYDVPWPKVHELLMNAAKATQEIEATPEPFVLQRSLDDFYVSYEINAYTLQSSNMSQIYSELHQHIQDQFNAAGIEILSPHYGALRDGNETTTPKQHRSADYNPPFFRVSRTQI
ncbi:MAG: mechanosensitive ion channel family protein [Vampirovibrio sp.]|nr:mechanosensitive ion channel family protein [Vampirovibrio sp.]